MFTIHQIYYWKQQAILESSSILTGSGDFGVLLKLHKQQEQRFLVFQ